MLHTCVRRFNMTNTIGKFLRTKQGLKYDLLNPITGFIQEYSSAAVRSASRPWLPAAEDRQTGQCTMHLSHGPMRRSAATSPQKFDLAPAASRSQRPPSCPSHLPALTEITFHTCMCFTPLGPRLVWVGKNLVKLFVVLIIN